MQNAKRKKQGSLSISKWQHPSALDRLYLDRDKTPLKVVAFVPIFLLSLSCLFFWLTGSSFIFNCILVSPVAICWFRWAFHLSLSSILLPTYPTSHGRRQRRRVPLRRGEEAEGRSRAQAILEEMGSLRRWATMGDWYVHSSFALAQLAWIWTASMMQSIAGSFLNTISNFFLHTVREDYSWVLTSKTLTEGAIVNMSTVKTAMLGVVCI